MKKALGGCLIVGVLILVVGGGAAWFFVLKPMWQAGSELVAAGKQFAQIAELDAKVRNTSAFRVPGDGRLEEAQVARFLAVQEAIDRALGGDWQALEQKYQTLQQSLRQEGREPNLQELFGAYSDLSHIILRAKEAQVDALNAQGMSLDEYRWVRTQAYIAVGIAMNDETPAQLQGSNAAHNADLLRPHRDTLQRTLPTSWLGF